MATRKEQWRKSKAGATNSIFCADNKEFYPLSTEMNESILLKFRPLVVISHHHPGRLRLRIRPGRQIHNLFKGQTTATLQDLSSFLPGLLGVESNIVTGSVLIHYDPRLLPFSDIDGFFRTDSTVTAAEILSRLLPIHNTNKEKHP